MNKTRVDSSSEWCGATEDGISLLARASPRPALSMLAPHLFAPNFLSPGDIIQVGD